MAFLQICGGLLGSYCYPEASEYHVQVCGDWQDWSFCLDDISDKCSTTQAQSIIDSVKQCLRDPEGYQASAPICELAKEYVDFAYDHYFDLFKPTNE